MNSLFNFAASYYYTTYPPTYPPVSTVDVASFLAIMGTIMLFGFIVFVVAYVVGALLLGKVFKKAGEKPWIAWVPFYNNWKLLEMGGQKGYWAVLALIPLVSIASAVFLYIAMHRIGRRFGKSDLFVLWAIFLPLVWFLILAFGEARWDGGVQPATVTEVPPTPPVPQI